MIESEEILYTKEVKQRFSLIYVSVYNVIYIGFKNDVHIFFVF